MKPACTLQRNAHAAPNSSIVPNRPAVTVVLGASAPHLQPVSAQAEALGNIEVLSDVRDMVSVCERAQLAIGAGGVSLLERLCCGLPSLLLSLAANQVPNAAAAGRLGVAEYLGDAAALSAEEISSAVIAFLSAAEQRKSMRSRGLVLIDAEGPARVARAVEQLGH